MSARAIETLFDEKNEPLFKMADLGKYLDTRNIKNNLKDFPSYYTCIRSKISNGCLTSTPPAMLWGEGIKKFLKISQLHLIQSKKLKAVALVKWLTSVEKILEQHRQAIEEKDSTCLIQNDLKSCDNQIQAIQYEKVELQSEIRAKD